MARFTLSVELKNLRGLTRIQSLMVPILDHLAGPSLGAPILSPVPWQTDSIIFLLTNLYSSV
jgi:hypothetical protein